MLKPPTLFVILFCVLVACDSNRRSVVVYTSLDEVFSRPVLEDFEARTGIRVDEVFDVEADKTTGLYHRLVQEHESGRPRADVFWNSEVARTIQLRRKGVLAPYDSPSASDAPACVAVVPKRGIAIAASPRNLSCVRSQIDVGNSDGATRSLL